MHVMDTGGAGRHASKTRQAAVDVLDHVGGGGLVPLQHLLDEIDAAARAIELVTEQHISGAGRKAEAAVNAGAQNLVGDRDVGIG